MKILMRIVSVAVIAVAVFLLLVTPLFMTSPEGTSVISSGVFIDVLALALLAFGVWIWRRAGREAR